MRTDSVDLGEREVGDVVDDVVSISSEDVNIGDGVDIDTVLGNEVPALENGAKGGAYVDQYIIWSGNTLDFGRIIIGFDLENVASVENSSDIGFGW